MGKTISETVPLAVQIINAGTTKLVEDIERSIASTTDELEQARLRGQITVISEESKHLIDAVYILENSRVDRSA